MSECQYLHCEIGDTKGFCRYYPDHCPFGRCKFIRFKAAEVIIQQPKPMPVAIKEPAKTQSAESPYKPVKCTPTENPMLLLDDVNRKRSAKYDWAKIEPIILEMRNAGESFENVSAATGVPIHSLMGRWHNKKMQSKCTRTNFRAARFDWDAVLPIMQEMRNNYEPWEAIAEKTGISRNALQNKWKSLGMVIETPSGGTKMNFAHKIINKIGTLINKPVENQSDPVKPAAIIPRFIPLNRKGFKGKVVDWEMHHEFIFSSLNEGKSKKWIAKAIGVERTDIRRYIARYENTMKAGGN